MSYPTSTTSKKPRNRKIKFKLNLSNKATYDELASKDRVGGQSYELWRKIIEDSNKEIAQYAITEYMGFLLPCFLGLLIVTKLKPYNAKGYINMVTLCKTGDVVQQHNMHTFGYLYKLSWIQTKDCTFALRQIYKFKAVRSVNRTLAILIKAGADYMTETFKLKALTLRP